MGISFGDYGEQVDQIGLLFRSSLEIVRSFLQDYGKRLPWYFRQDDDPYCPVPSTS
jgi:hypothetical protein